MSSFRRLFAISALTGAGVLAFTVIIRLSPDALALAVGVLFGILAGIPITILALVSNRRTTTEDNYWRQRALIAEQRFQVLDVSHDRLPSSPHQIEHWTN